MLKFFHKILGGKYEKGFKGLGSSCLDMCMGGAALLSVSCANNSNSSNNGGSGGSEAPIGPIGSKSAPDAVGDIVFSDGTAEAYSAGLNLTQAQKNAAVAVIFYTAPTSSSDLGIKKLGVGLKKGTGLMWAPNPSTGYNTKFDTVDVNGSGNWSKILTADPTGAANSATNYPAFNFCNTYGVALVGSSTGWYLPAKNDLLALNEVKTTVDNAIGKIGESGNNVAKLGDNWHWSSSQDSANNYYAVYVNFLNGMANSTSKSNSSSVVRAICKFNER